MIKLKMAALAVSVLAAVGTIHHTQAKEIGPEDQFCQTINNPAFGDEVVLRPGKYRGPCMIRRGGAAGRPLVIRAKDPSARPRIDYDGEGANVIEVHADHVVIRGLAFGPTHHADGVRIRASKNVSILDCEFSQMGGIAVVVNQSSLQGLLVSGNVVTLSQATAMYFGCHDGDACRLTDVVIEKNRIDGVAAAEKEVGYGIQVKLNSAAIVRDNVIKDTKGPGIMIYGATHRSFENVIERNFISGSRTSSGIVVGGGPALVRNNIAIGNTLGGIALHDYAQRGLLQEIKVGFNTLLDNGKGAIIATQDKLSETMMVGNVGASGAAGSLFPPRQMGLTVIANIACERACFADFANLDLSPALNSMLGRQVVSMKAAWIPQDDFFGQRRSLPPKVGAVETAGQALAAGAAHQH